MIPPRAGKHIAHSQTHSSVCVQVFRDSSDANPSRFRQLPGVREVLAHHLPWLKGLCIPQKDPSCPMLGSRRFLPSYGGLCSD